MQPASQPAHKDMCIVEYAALTEESDDEDDDVHTVITHMAALTTQSQLMASTAAETNGVVHAWVGQNSNILQVFMVIGQR